MSEFDGTEFDGTEPYAGFAGRVGRTVAGSEPWWPARPTAPSGAPNVIVMMVDDLGFSDLGCYGSEIDTPNLDRLATEGVRLRDYHATPMCSPTRAALLTGLNPHDAGIGHVAHSDPGFPGYAMELTRHAATAPEIFGDSGYFTAMVGKWHLTKDSNCSDAGPFDSWPCQRGFDRFYGFLDGFTNLHHPHRLVEDNHSVETDQYPDGYYLTDELTDQAISMLRSSKSSNPARPFFLYFSHGAVHAPLQAKAADIEKYRGRYDAGWDELRAERFERMRELGVLPLDVEVAPRNTEPGNDVRPWADLSADEQKIYARYMEVYAGMVDCVDQNFGRLREALEEMGEWENTIVLFTSDNGASREGEVEGTTGYYVHLLGDTDVAADMARLDEIGGPTTTAHYPRGWAMACNTPFRLYKINAHAGGHQVPFIARLPDSVAAAGSWRDQYAHVTDLLPTLLDVCGLEAPAERNGLKLKSMVGASFVACLDDPAAPSQHHEQYTEMSGHRGLYRDGWEVVTLHQPMTEFGDHEWELYDLSTDPTELHDLAATEPERVAELGAAWEAAAWQNQVYPLDEGSALKFVVRPPSDEVYGRPVTLFRGTNTLERWRSLQLIMLRSFTIAVRVDHAETDSGILVAHGDQGGGYVIWIDDRGLHLGHNDGRGRFDVLDGGLVAAGAREITASFAAPGSNRWIVTVAVDGHLSETTADWPCLFPMAPFEGIDVGLDRRSPVSWELYQQHGPHPYSGTIHEVQYVPGDPAPDAPVNLEGLLRTMGAKFE